VKEVKEVKEVTRGVCAFAIARWLCWEAL